MRIEIYVQARMQSTRLPGKVMLPVLKRPLLDYLVERLEQVKKADTFAILTSTKTADDTIASYCERKRVSCFRGSEDDVLTRYYQAASERRPDAIVRITADCPLSDPDIIDSVLEKYEKGSFDYVSNTLVRTFPRGIDVEVFSFDALKKTYEEAQATEEREHVTLYMYRHPEKFRLANYASQEDLSGYRLTVDTEEDFQLIRLILENLYPKKPQFKLEDVIQLMRLHPDWAKINAHVKQKKI